MSFQPSSMDDSSEANESGGRLRRQQFLQIAGYEIHYKIGSGGMATVYHASQRSLGRDVAIKVLKWESDDDDQFVQRFKKEGRILAQLLHTNIVTIYDVGISEDKKLFISIEYLTGGTLADRIKIGLSFDSVIQIARAIANALGYAHERGIVHRDVKPSNIMFRHDGTPVLTDFGVARVIESKTAYTMEGLTIGSPGYMSPEQAMGESATSQSDLYSLGVVIYEMLTGRRLYQAENPISVAMKHVNDPIPKLPKQYTYLQSILNKLLAKKRTDRYRNTHEFLDALDAIVPSDTRTQPKTPGDFDNLGLLEFTTGKFRSLFKNQRIRWPIFVVIISIIILLIAIFYVVSRKFVDQSEIMESAMPVDPAEQARRNQQIATLLKLADAQRKIGLLAGDSKGDNAEATYRQILIFDPGNAQALAGLEAIANEYARRARQRLSANALPESLQQIELGLAASPQHRELLRLRQEVAGRMAAIRLQKAQEEEQQRSQLQAEQFLEQARSSFQEGLLELSLVHIEQGLLAVPKQPDLLALREQVRARLAEQQRQAEAERQQREEEVRWQAEGAERRKAEKIRLQVAAERRRQEAGHYFTQAVEAQRKGEFVASEQWIEKGLEVLPNHAELLHLREAVRAQLAAEQLRQAEQVKREQDIKALLQQAEVHWQAKRLTAPAENNAEAAYRQVLKLDEGNAEAQAGLERIAREYLQQARQRQAAGALPESLELIDQGLAVVPKQGELLRLRQEVEHGIAEVRVRQEQEAKRRLQAEQLLAQARTRFKEGALEVSLAHIEQGLLAVPDQPDLLALREQVKAQIAEQARQQAEAIKRQQEEEARRQAAEAERQQAEQARQQAEAIKRQKEEEARRQAAEAERQQAEAIKLQQEEEARRQAAEAERQRAEQARQQAEAAKRRREADQYWAQAVELRRQDDRVATMQAIEKGLALIPDHEGLTRLRQEVSAEIAAQQRQQVEREQREREIASLLEQADAHVQAWRLTTPAGNNAQETYQQVLKLDAGNAQARAGLERIAEGYLQLAQKRRAAGALQDSLTFIERGLGVVPEHAELLRLREAVRAEESAAQQRQEQQKQDQQRQEQQKQDQQRQEQQKQGQQRKLEQQRQEAQRLEQQQKLEQQRLEQRRLDQQRRLEQQQERQRLLEQRRQEQQRQEQQNKLEQQRKAPPPRREPPPEPRPQPPSEPVRPRIFGTF